MARKKATEHVSFKNGNVQQDNINVNPRVISIADASGYATRKGLENFLVVDVPTGTTGEVMPTVMNAVSNDYGLLRNEDFYQQIEQRLDGAGIGYLKRSINRGNRSFTVDYILEDNNMHVDVKGKADKIKPMIRATNSYDGSNQTSGHFGFFREICSNGLHIAEMELQFKQRHRGNVIEIVMPKIEDLVELFMNNEYYSLHKKFEVMAEKAISDVEGFVKYTLGKTGLFKYEKSEKNPEEASMGAQYVIDIINNEAKELGTGPNLWLGYNAFNEYIHTQNARPFFLQEKADRKLFDAVMAQVN